MAMTRDDRSQQSISVATAALPQGGGRPFYERLNQIPSAADIGAFVEKLCAPFYARMGPQSLAPARYLIGSAERRRDVEVRLPKFGHLLTLTLVNHLATLNAQLHDWRRTRAASTCNHRRHALMHLVPDLYGRRAAIDLKDLEDLVRFPLPQPCARWVDRAHIDAVPDRLSPGTKTSTRLRLMHWTGMRPSQIARLTRTDFRLSDPALRQRAPRQGRSTGHNPSRRRSPSCLHDFIAADAFGPSSTQSANTVIHAAAQKAQQPPFTVYQIRRSFDDVAPPRRHRPLGHPRPVRTHERGHDEDLRRAEPRQAERRNPTSSRCVQRPITTSPLYPG